MASQSGEHMNAVIIEGGKGAAEALKLGTAVKPKPSEGEILIRVRAAGINRPDVFQRLGFYPPPPGVSETLGLEVAGEVVVPAGRWQVGDRVCALLAGGGYAEYAVCDARHALPVPDRMSLTDAAGLPETVYTVWANVFEHGALKSGDTLLIHGATSGIGVTAIQMARAAGAKVIATGRSEAKANAARAVGANVAIDTSTEDYVSIVSGEGGADVVLSMVGAEYFDRDMEAIKAGGRIVFIAALGGDELKVSVLRVMQKNAVITGSTLRARPAEEKARLTELIERMVWPWLASGQLTTKTDRVFPLAEAAAAHAHLEGGAHVGKIILQVGEAA